LTNFVTSYIEFLLITKIEQAAQVKYIVCVAAHALERSSVTHCPSWFLIVETREKTE
jgi:hypothetical protein